MAILKTISNEVRRDLPLFLPSDVLRFRKQRVSEESATRSHVEEEIGRDISPCIKSTGLSLYSTKCNV